jgi:CheY-like chemotaxis protein
VVGEAADGREAVRLAGTTAADVVLMDIRMPLRDGVAATRAITEAAAGNGTPKVLILTTFEWDEYVFTAVRAGANGFLLERSPPETLIEGIRTLAAGDALLGPSITRRLLAEFARTAPAAPPPEIAIRLARRSLAVSGREVRMSAELRSAVVLITGVMASGKSTVASMLAARLPRAAHVRGDVFRRMIVSGRQELLPEATAEATAQLRLRYRLSAMVADEYARDGWTAVVQDVILGTDLGEYVTAVNTRPLYVIVLAPTPAAVQTRERRRPKTGYGAWSIEALDQALREETPRIGLWLDSSEQTPEQTVAAILDNLPAARIRIAP